MFLPKQQSLSLSRNWSHRATEHVDIQSNMLILSQNWSPSCHLAVLRSHSLGSLNLGGIHSDLCIRLKSLTFYVTTCLSTDTTIFVMLLPYSKKV